MDMIVDDTLLALLRSVDTPTVCNAIEVAQGKRGFDAFTRGTMLCSDPNGGAMVGYAMTAKIAAVAPPTEAPDVICARRMAYYKAMSEGLNWSQPRVCACQRDRLASDDLWHDCGAR